MIFTLLLTAETSARADTGRIFSQTRTWGYQLQGADPAKLKDATYDTLVIDYSRDGSQAAVLTKEDVTALQIKPDGSRRIVLAYLSIGEAETYRYYWNRSWSDWWFIRNFWSAPSWRGRLNTDWAGNYAVRYWEPAWQEIILGNGGYLDQILAAGFDGVWLDKVDSSTEAVSAGRPTAKQDMVSFVTRIAEHGRKQRPDFLIVPQNATNLLKFDNYRQVISGFGKEDLLYGESGDEVPNDPPSIDERVALLKQLPAAGKPVLAVEYLRDPAKIEAARKRIEQFGFIPHFADRDLTTMRRGDLPGNAIRPQARDRARTSGALSRN